MNYIVLNGINSTTVKGLLIQALPPISKPLMRTSVETIDGRDGDIVTRLGYSAYDKEISIGLHGDFDVDDAIKYFDSEGDVVFSNEPDKFYKYQILEQIDFERLIRFRTAKVKFHVQPFKYSDVDRIIEYNSNLLTIMDYTNVQNGITATAENNTITLKGTANQPTEFYIPIKALKLKTMGYTLTVNSTGIVEGTALRLISGSPSNAKTFSGNYLPLEDTATVTQTATDAGTLTYDYLWFYIPKGTLLNVNLNIEFVNNTDKIINVYNRGNIVSRPKLTMFGSGNVEVYVNGTAVLRVNIDEDYITIDSAEMNAYHEGTLKNRQVVGDYNNLMLNTGDNTVSFDGNVKDAVIEDFSRWI